ncbi:hypothetical protein HMPREF1557_02001 [Streptococcus sobrinus W1703]|uniref:Uncharacterized protein n=1 Tax=Streptococcus sobrinus W1703 TaxID=1227275 RepID=U2K9P4_9STRE|nr:hypothetical protein HMPREF1557_02001 [Streptococcus sobrinus W1703]
MTHKVAKINQLCEASQKTADNFYVQLSGLTKGHENQIVDFTVWLELARKIINNFRRHSNKRKADDAFLLKLVNSHR